MPDRKKVIEGLERCSKHDGSECPHCPYFNGECTDDLMADVLALLKEQKTKLICNLLGGQPYEVYCRECRTTLCILGKDETMNDVKSIFSYCPHCGRLVDWE